jgi:TetR/AcrR family transcriptional repressor of nem operon
MRSSETKMRIIQAARTLFSTHGCQSTSIVDIITASGITKGGFYHYFKSKENLCAALIGQLRNDYQQLFDSLSPNTEPIEALRGLLRKIAELNASGEWVNCRLILRLTSEAHQYQPELRDKIQEFWRWYSGALEELISRCRAAGQIKTDISPKLQTRLVLAIMTGSIMLEETSAPGPPLVEMAETAIHCLQA